MVAIEWSDWVCCGCRLETLPVLASVLLLQSFDFVLPLICFFFFLFFVLFLFSFVFFYFFGSVLTWA